ncbi:MAG TPA: hypothetical protein VGD02_06565 [Gemmatimonadaceae bacterium]
MIPFLIFAALIVGGLVMLDRLRPQKDLPEFTEEQIKQKWRELGFFCEVDHVEKTWTLAGSRAGLLFFPDLLLGYSSDPANAAPGAKKKYGPYGTLEVMTWLEPGFGNSIHGSTKALAYLAEIVEAKLASAQPGEEVRIRSEFAPNSPYTLLLDIRPDGFDPASADRERLGALTSLAEVKAAEAKKETKAP